MGIVPGVSNTAAAVSNLKVAVTTSLGSEIFSCIQKDCGRAKLSVTEV